ncbi:DUF4062 domain-containing protein [Roseobacter sp. EG26]|uniref:DUF4062 domain-containing protein n=1 Tax=Roseobacter sp. EG26 TaxID=3412477 RepID=UPI003CE47A7A
MLSQVLRKAAQTIRDNFQGAGDRRKIFISGTYDELVSYRGLVARGIQDAGHEPLEPHETGAASQVILRRVENELRIDADGYFGFYGARYGSSIYEEDPHSPSFTEFEYDIARDCFEDTAYGPPIFLMISKHGSEVWSAIMKQTIDWAAKNTRGNEVLGEQIGRQAEFTKKVSSTTYNGRTVSTEMLEVSKARDIAPRAKAALTTYYNNILKAQLPTSTTSAASGPALGTTQRQERDPARVWPLQTGQAKTALKAYEQNGRSVSPVLTLLMPAARGSEGDLSAFADHVSQSTPWDPEYSGHASFDPKHRWATSAEQVVWHALDQAPPVDPARRMSALARLIVALDAQVTLTLQAVNLYPGNLTALLTDFVDELTSALRSAGQEALNNRHQVLLLLGYRGDPAVDQKALTSRLCFAKKGPVDFSKVIVLDSIGTHLPNKK